MIFSVAKSECARAEVMPRDCVVLCSNSLLAALFLRLFSSRDLLEKKRNFQISFL